MGLHERHTHGRVFHGLAAREHLENRKRDSHGSDIKMHVPEGFQAKETTDESESDTDPAVEVVYVTLSQTFSGAAVYSTMTGDPTAEIASSSASAPTVLKGGSPPLTKSSSATAQETSVVLVSPAQSRSGATTLATATSSSASDTVMGSATASRAAGTPIHASSTATSTSQATTDQTTNNGLSAGGKAGLAIGIILAVGLLAGLAFFMLRKKKRPTNEEALNEKHSSFPRGAPIGAAAATGAFAASRGMQHGERESSRRDSTQTEKVPSSVRSTRTTSTAPRLSLRPITQLMTNFGENRKSGTALDVAAAGGLAAPASAWERRPVNSATENPFSDTTAQGNAVLTDPFDEMRSANGSTATVNQPKTSWEGSEVQTPSSATFGTAAVGVAAGGPGDAAARGPNNVHRVQLDFKPSMDDELELRSGQLVRMLHEYDDGWALCIRMDRSQQGVAPRTCLSKLPVKPRPQGPPGGSLQSRPGTAQSNRGHPNAPDMMVPRPLTPTSSGRSPSPQEIAPGNSNSPPNVPPRVQRKPVPGIAI